MQIVQKENTPVIYSAVATKVLRFSYPKDRECFAMHWHERFEILYIRQGEMEYIRGAENGIIKEGQALIIPPRMAHYAKVTRETTYDVLMFDLRYFYNETDVCKKLLPEIFEGNAQFDAVCDDSEILRCIDSVCYGAEPDSLQIISQIYLLLHLFMQKKVAKLFPVSSNTGMRDIIKYIEENFDKDLSTNTLSLHFGYTPAHFCRKFKKATGLTPVTYLKIYRLERAFDMIKNGEGQIFEIAQKCGFSDTNYFTRCFRAHYKFPPTHFKFKNRQL